MFRRSESDRDGEDFVLHVLDLGGGGDQPQFRRGDCNDDGAVDISDAVFTLGWLFLGGRNPRCEDACDSNDGGTVNISDAIATLGVLFLANGEIPLPGMEACGVDPTEDAPGCGRNQGCP